jgi:hypothetical protein
MLTLANIAPEAQGLTESGPILGLNPRSMTAPHRMSTLIPIVAMRCRILCLVIDALAATVPHGWTHGTRPVSSSVMILSVIS